jgi:anti-sigma B factor antagonist
MLEVIDTREQGAVVVHLKGRLDGSTANDLDTRLRLLTTAGESRLVLDMSGVEYIASVGLRVILVVMKQLRAANGKLAMAELKEQVKQAFELSGFSKLCQVCATRTEALAAVQ